MNYIVKPGNIASVCYVVLPDGTAQQYIFDQEVATKRPLNVVPDDTYADVKFRILPVQVQAAVNRHFATIFSLPVERREEYIRSFQPLTVEASY